MKIGQLTHFDAYSTGHKIRNFAVIELEIVLIDWKFPRVFTNVLKSEISVREM